MLPKTDYQVIVWKHDGNFIGRVRELGIFETASSLPALWEQIESKKNEILQKFKASGAEAEIPLPLHLEEKKFEQVSGKILPRWLKVVGLILISYLVVLSLLWSFKSLILEQVGLTSIIISRIENFSTHLKFMPADKKNKLRQSLQSIAKEGRPFLQDIKPLFSELSSMECSEGEQEVGAVRKNTTFGTGVKN